MDQSTYEANATKTFADIFGGKSISSRPGGSELLDVAPRPRLAILDVSHRLYGCFTAIG